MMTNIELAQTFMAARLRSVDYFSDIFVGAPRVFKDGDKIGTPKTIQDTIDRALQGLQPTGGKVGAAVRVFQPAFSNKKPNLPGLQGIMTMLIRCETNPVTNFGTTGTGKYVSEIGFQVLLAGQTRFGSIGSFFADAECFLPYYAPDSKMMTVDILLQCNLAVNPLPGCVTPICAVAGNTFTLTNVTAGADIWYSVDGETFPSPFETGAQLYTAPFTVTPDPTTGSAKVFFAAYKPGLAGSPVGFQFLNQ